MGNSTSNQVTESQKVALDYYSEHWYYRNTHYWKLTLKHIYIVLIIIFLPNITELAKIVYFQEDCKWLFPVMGVLVSLAFVFLLRAEAERMHKTSDAIDKILNEIGQTRPSIENVEKSPKIANCIPWLICAFHVIVAFAFLCAIVR